VSKSNNHHGERRISPPWMWSKSVSLHMGVCWRREGERLKKNWGNGVEGWEVGKKQRVKSTNVQGKRTRGLCGCKWRVWGGGKDLPGGPKSRNVDT